MEAADDGYDPPANSGDRELRKQVRELKRMLGEKVLEADFFKGAFAKDRASTPEQRRYWRDGVFEQIRELMTMQGNLGVERMCQLAEVSHASFYRSLQERAPAEEDVEVCARSRNGNRGQAWCITPTAACSTPHATTSACFANTR